MSRLVKTQVLTRLERLLKSGEVAVQGEVACIDLGDGALVPGSVATDLLPIGYFESNATGDGTLTVFVTLFSPVTVAAMISSGTGPVADDDVGNVCYLHNASSNVSMTSTGKSVAGRVWAVSGTTVWVQMAGTSMGIQGIPGA